MNLSPARLLFPARRLPAILLSASLFSTSLLVAQTAVWTSTTAGGNWSSSSAWTPSGVPSAVAVSLGDVTAGTRTVAYDTAGASVTSLALTQTTADAVNTLTLSAALTLTGTGATVFSQTLGSGVGAGGIVVNLNTGGTLAFTGDTSAATVGFTNAGTLNLAGGAVSFTSAANRTTLPVFTNTGIVNSSGGSIVATNTTASTGTTGVLTVNNGLAPSSAAQLNFTGGTTLIGRTVDGDRGSFVLNNYGSIALANTATVSLNNRGEASNQTIATTLDNKAGATLTLGSATTAGTAILEFTRDGTVPSSTTWSYTLANAGTVSVYGQSKILHSNLTVVNAVTLSNGAGGVLNLAGDATGILIGGDAAAIDARTNLALTNSGTVHVQVFTGAASGLTRFGTFATGSNARGGVAIDNAGAFTIDPNATFLAQASYAGSTTYGNRFTNAATGTLTLGSDESPATGGTLQLAVRGGRTSGTNTDHAQFQNDGTATLHGTSVIERSSTVGMATGETTFTFDNNTGATLNLRDTARIGNTTRAMLFTNAGTVVKDDAGTASVQSSSTGTAANTGTIHVKAGILAFSNALDTSAAASVLRFDVDSASAGRLSTEGGLALGTGGASLELVFTSSTLTASYDLLEFSSVTGSFAAIALSGSGFSGSLLRDNGTWTGVSNGYAFSFAEATGILSATSAIPEPSTVALISGALALLAVAIRSRRR